MSIQYLVFGFLILRKLPRCWFLYTGPALFKAILICTPDGRVRIMKNNCIKKPG